ncbi:hypothetical protein ACLGE5_08020 [Helicobacter pylori]
MKIISFENDSVCDKHLLIPCRIYCVELEIGHNDLGLNAIEKCALKLKELGVKDEELKGFLGFGGELDLLEPILEKIETKTLEEYKKIHVHFYYNLINQEFLHFVDLERVRAINGKELKNNIVEFFADSSFKAESLYYPKENNKPLNVNDIIIRKTIETSIKYHKQDTLRHAKVVSLQVLGGVYYLHAKAFDDDNEKIRVECKNHPIEKMVEKLEETNPEWFEKWKEKQRTQTGDPKQSKRIKVFKDSTAFDGRLHIIEWNLSNLDKENKKLKICGALYDIYEQIFDETPSLKGRDLETYKAQDLSKKFMHLGFEQISKDLNDSRLNALLRYEEKVMQALAKSYPSFLQDLHDIKKYRNKDKHGEKSQDGFSLTRGELERYRDEIYFLVENLLKNPLIKERENAQEEKHYKKNAEIDAQSQLSNLNAPKALFECFVGVNLAKAKYYSKKEKREKEKMILNFCKIFEIILFEAIQKQPELSLKTKDELLGDYPNLKNLDSLREVREDFLKRAFKNDEASLGAYVLVLLSCKYFESVFEKVQEWKIRKREFKKLEKQALEYFNKIANKIYPKEKR